jgi:anti-sigma factor RsiW
MTNERDQSLIQALIDGELDKASNAELESRLAADPVLRAERERMEAVMNLVRGLPQTPVSGEFQNRISALAAPSQPFGDWRRMAAAVLLGAIMSSAATYAFIGGEPRFDEASAIASSHRRSLLAASPIDIASSDSHTVKPWLDARLGLSPPAADLSGDGFVLIGGRADVIGEKPVPSLVYRHNEHLVTLLAEPVATGATAAPHHVEAGGLRMVNWLSGGFSYWAVSDTEWSNLDRFVARYQAVTGP